MHVLHAVGLCAYYNIPCVEWRNSLWPAKARRMKFLPLATFDRGEERRREEKRKAMHRGKTSAFTMKLFQLLQVHTAPPLPRPERAPSRGWGEEEEGKEGGRRRGEERGGRVEVQVQQMPWGLAHSQHIVALRAGVGSHNWSLTHLHTLTVRQATHRLLITCDADGTNSRIRNAHAPTYAQWESSCTWSTLLFWQWKTLFSFVESPHWTDCCAQLCTVHSIGSFYGIQEGNKLVPN